MRRATPGKQDLRSPRQTDKPSPIDPILASHSFERSLVLKGLLDYLWQHHGEEFSEYAIATEALGRRTDFDPKVDATVRVEISRLRQRLKEFYATEGAEIRERVRVPVGSHYLELFQAEAPRAVSAGRRSYTRPTLGLRPRMLLPILCSCVIFMAVDTYFRIETSFTKGMPPAAKVATLPPFWREFLANGMPTHIVIPRPTFVTWGTDLIARDTNINDFSGWRSSPALTVIGRQFGDPRLMQMYAVATDALGAVRLASFLQAHNLALTVNTLEDGPPDLLSTGNVIALGTSKTLRGFDQELDKGDAGLDFFLLPEERCVENRQPENGEPRRFCEQIQSSSRSVSPGVIAVLPGRVPTSHVMTLKARHTLALASFLSSAPELGRFDKIWRAHGSPLYFELVVDCEMDGNQCVRVWPVAMHTRSRPE